MLKQLMMRAVARSLWKSEETEPDRQVARSVDYEFPPSLMSLVGDVPPVKSEEFRPRRLDLGLEWLPFH